MFIKTSRSKIESWYTCPRYRYWRYHFAQKGLQKVGSKAVATRGQAIHTINALNLVDPNNVNHNIMVGLEDVKSQFPLGIPFRDELLQEQLSLVENITRAYNRCRFPQLREMGTIIAVEQETPFKLAIDIECAWRADAIIETNEEQLVIIDYKPTAYGNYQFVRGWERNHQISNYVCGAQSLYPSKPVLGVKIEGYVRGQRRSDKQVFKGEVKIQNSPLCYVWVNDHTGQISPEYQRAVGWIKTPFWETSLSSEEYINEFLTLEQVEKLFLAPVPPICPTPTQIESWKQQTIFNERRVESAAKYVNMQLDNGDERIFLKVLNEHFPQNMHSCYQYGEDYPCECEQLCFNREVTVDPLALGLYEETIDHHLEDTNETSE